MQPVNLFDLASHQARWLSVRQSAVAGNIANINTPGYKAVDVQPFERVLENRQLQMQPTAPGHIAIGANRGDFDVRTDETMMASTSGNSVSIEQELVKSGEVRRGIEMNTAIVRSFHRMIMMATK